MAFAYHMEALRRQRIIDRKHATLARIAIMQAENERMKSEAEQRCSIIKQEQEETKAKEREIYLKSMGRTGKSKQVAVVSENYTQMLDEQKKHISQKDLKHQEKVLRDNCLFMGNVNEYFLA